MPLLGAHTSIAGGLYRAFDRLKEIRGESMQIFVKNERQWNAPEISEDAANRFLQSWREAGCPPVSAHDTYLINLASMDPVILEKSVAAFADELRRSELLRIKYLITHPGSHMGLGVEAGLVEFTRNLDRAISLSHTSDVMILIENTAGQGSQLGSSFDEMGFIIGSSAHRERVGMCFDTCHAFAAGYDIRTPEAYGETFAVLDRTVGLQKLLFFHLNDSKRELGSRVDRHEDIGKGEIGTEAFRLLLNDSHFSNHPMVIETPKKNGLEEDKKNLTLLRSLLK